VRLLYQTPEIYMTDIAEVKKSVSSNTRAMPQYKFACRSPPKDEDDNLGETPKPPSPLHPKIVFNGAVSKIHVHLLDKTTGEVFWDAHFKLGAPSPKALLTGKSELGNSLRPLNKKDQFRTLCVAADDPEIHDFDLSIQSEDGYYYDGATPVGDWEGLFNNHGIKGHIGFRVYRLPVLETLTKTEDGLPRESKEVLGTWGPDKDFSTGPVLQGWHERLLARAQDMFEGTKDSRNYYDYLPKFDRRQAKDFAYLEQFEPPLMLDNFRPYEFEALDKKRAAS